MAPSSYLELDHLEFHERLAIDLGCFDAAIVKFPALFGLYSKKKSGEVADKFDEYDDLRESFSRR